MVNIKLGIIGMSEGNGHPFSWSSIINGYSPENLATCGFSTIYDYMVANQHPSTCFSRSKVTCVLTHSRGISEKVAACANIPFIADDTRQLTEQVDAVLLARDDAENHICFAKDALIKGLPIFVDKPIALKLDDLEHLYQLAYDERLIYSCSALRFSDEILLNSDEQKKVGEITEIHCITPKSWDRYAIHLIDPLLHIMAGFDYTKLSVVSADNYQTKIMILWENGVKSTIQSSEHYKGPIQFTYIGVNGKIIKKFKNSYEPFKKSLQYFINNIRKKNFFNEYEKLEKMVKLIEFGRVF